jgi:hypothetical protein
MKCIFKPDFGRGTGVDRLEFKITKVSPFGIATTLLAKICGMATGGTLGTCPSGLIIGVDALVYTPVYC